MLKMLKRIYYFLKNFSRKEKKEEEEDKDDTNYPLW